jgi:hypothetical protein
MSDRQRHFGPHNQMQLRAAPVVSRNFDNIRWFVNGCLRTKNGAMDTVNELKQLLVSGASWIKVYSFKLLRTNQVERILGGV